MGIRKSKITPSINVDDMLKKAEISHEIETEKLDVDKKLKEICEIKETLLKIQQDLQDAIKAEGNASVVLKKAISNSNSIVNGICNAITKAEQNTEFRATIKSEHFTQLQQLLNQSVKTWETMLENHLVFRFLDESFGDIFVRLYGCIGIDCILRYIITMALLFTI